MSCFSLRACYTRSHLYQRRTFCKSLSKPLPILSMNLQDSLFSIICKTHSNDSFFLVVLLFWKESTTNKIILSFVPYFLWFILFMKASVGGGVQQRYKEAFYRYCRHRTWKLQQVRNSRISLKRNGPRMKANTVTTILLVSFLVACLMVDESYGVIGIFGARRHSAKQKETPEPTLSEERRPGSQRKGGMRSSFERKRPDRFPEGPMFDKRSRNRFYNY